MAVVAVQIGQCGNQLGVALFSRIAEEIAFAQSVRDEARARRLASIYFRDSEANKGSIASSSCAAVATDARVASLFTSLDRKREDTYAVSSEAWTPDNPKGLSPQWPMADAPAIARSILVDSEPGVLDTCLSGSPYSTPTGSRDKTGSSVIYSSNRDFTFSRSLHESHSATSFQWQYSKRNAIYGARATGCGNNWAIGYLREGPRREEAIVGALQCELEKVDSLSSVLLIYSLAGGTGSGIGAFMNAVCHDLLGSTATVNLAVWPFASGELSVQSYNTALSLAHAYFFMDGMILAENTRLEELCGGTGTSFGGPSFSDMNRAISAAVASATLFPHHRWVTATAPGRLQSQMKTQSSHHGRKTLRHHGAGVASFSGGRQTLSRCSHSNPPEAVSPPSTPENSVLPIGASPLPFVVRELCSQPAYKLLTVFHNSIPTFAPVSKPHTYGSPQGFLSSPSCRHDSPFGCDTYGSLFKQMLRQFSRSTLRTPSSPADSGGLKRNAGIPGGFEQLSNCNKGTSPQVDSGKRFWSSMGPTGEPVGERTPFSEGGQKRTFRGRLANQSAHARTSECGDCGKSGVPTTDTVRRTGERRTSGTLGAWAFIRGTDIEAAEAEEGFYPEEHLDSAVRICKENTVPIRVRMNRPAVWRFPCGVLEQNVAEACDRQERL
ncbi:tubulin/FtsZ family, GTPase domain-containing protein [Toxoplasma gondii GT1]|uniref:Tubulin delta chain n=2 Tax=Toxoplasma gondii TaxID=5811 RepID=S7UIP6_TOXGG|nr:tubulin/FtsZ family, GTPase domain-containing protein [Toxoplasma gondii GT1]PIL98480.1 tubulin/FtsZ family, GTPase domain-containing protein [Toxoplasma gondii COUG]